LCSLRWFFYRNQEVVIVGAGDSVRKHITYLNFVKKVTMLVRGENSEPS
jgi:thioredoxin reductase